MLAMSQLVMINKEQKAEVTNFSVKDLRHKIQL